MNSVKNKKRIKTSMQSKSQPRKHKRETHLKRKQARRSSRNTIIKGKMLRPGRTWLKRLCTKGRQDYNDQEIEMCSRRIAARHKQ